MVTKSKAKSATPAKSATAAKAAVPTKAATKPKSTATTKPDFKAAAAADQPEPARSAEPKSGTVGCAIARSWRHSFDLRYHADLPLESKGTRA